MARTSEGGLSLLFRFLVAYRLLIYLGGLLAISMPLGLAWVFDIELSEGARMAIVGVSFGLILLTYLAERRVGLDHVEPGTGESTESYSTRLQVTVMLAIVGVAVGIYLLLEGSAVVGLLFLTGALLFFQVGYSSEREDAEEI